RGPPRWPASDRQAFRAVVGVNNSTVIDHMSPRDVYEGSWGGRRIRPPCIQSAQEVGMRRPFRVHRIAGALGAEIADLDLSAELDDQTVATLRQAWLQHLVLFFRDQELPPV